MFRAVYSFLKSFHGIFRQPVNLFLCQNRAVVNFFVNEVHCDAGYGNSCLPSVKNAVSAGESRQ